VRPLDPARGRPVLLDVNLLVALFDPDHIHHETAHDWFADNGSEGWATCPMTENGFVRVLANPAYGATSRPSELVARLRRFCKGPRYQFWTDDISLRDETLFDPAFLTSHRQLTDIYLLGLAKKRGGRLATFDRTIPVKAIVGARRDLLEVVAPTE
jgi:toxin-antitoxin system PIN domain toxin